MTAVKKAAVMETSLPDLLAVNPVDVVDCKATTLLLTCAVLEQFHRSQLSAAGARLTTLTHTPAVEEKCCQLLESLHLAVVEALFMIEIKRFAAGIHFITR